MVTVHKWENPKGKDILGTISLADLHSQQHSSLFFNSNTCFFKNGVSIFTKLYYIKNNGKHLDFTYFKRNLFKKIWSIFYRTLHIHIEKNNLINHVLTQNICVHKFTKTLNLKKLLKLKLHIFIFYPKFAFKNPFLPSKGACHSTPDSKNPVTVSFEPQSSESNTT